MDPSEDHRYQVKLAKDNLSKMYDVVQEEILEEKIVRVENSHKRSKHKNSWNLINEISDWKRARYLTGKKAIFICNTGRLSKNVLGVLLPALY